MAELTTIARPYARAAFLFAREQGELDRWQAMLGLAAQLVQNPDMDAFLDRPEAGVDAKVAAFAEVGGDQFDQHFLNLLAQCAEHKRLAALPDIYRLFCQLVREVEQTTDVELVSAFPLSEADVATLVAGLKKRLGCEVSVTSRVDQALIGGVVIRAGDTVIDGSVRGRLARLTEQLNSRH